MWRPHRYRPTSYYYFSWLLNEEEERQNRQFKRDARRRFLIRKNIDPMDISDTEFILRYRLSKEAFLFLCNVLRERTSLKPSQRTTLELKVLCALLFYASGSYQRIVGMGKNLAQTTVSSFVREVTDALNSNQIINEFIKFPETREERDIIKHEFYAKYGMPGVIGCIDGSHFHIFTPRQEIEHLFYCRKHYHSLNVQMICDSTGTILNVNAKYGGATHDAFIWENSVINTFMKRLHENNENVWLLGDSGYPQRPWLMTPIPDAVEGSPEAQYTSIHGQTRVVIENTFGRLKNRWRCLSKDRVLHYAPERCSKIIMACCVLHNLAIKYRVSAPESDDVHTERERERTHIELTHRENDTSHSELIRGRALRNILINRLTHNSS